MSTLLPMIGDSYGQKSADNRITPNGATERSAIAVAVVESGSGNERKNHRAQQRAFKKDKKDGQFSGKLTIKNTEQP
ncbi:unnamed protein product [Toxocara canis]|uniref:Uncharacterized protein n=1 Tax=Toxocara canis TaxID=6265 RepID=A0A183TW25_TOXCA|nr:unnamed protein product [Toxocara canis]